MSILINISEFPWTDDNDSHNAISKYSYLELRLGADLNAYNTSRYEDYDIYHSNQVNQPKFRDK